MAQTKICWEKDFLSVFLLVLVLLSLIFSFFLFFFFLLAKQTLGQQRNIRWGRGMGGVGLEVTVRPQEDI